MACQNGKKVNGLTNSYNDINQVCARVAFKRKKRPEKEI